MKEHTESAEICVETSDAEAVSTASARTMKRSYSTWIVGSTVPAVVLCLLFGCDVAKVNDLRLSKIEVVDPRREALPAELAGWSPQGRLVKLSFTTKTNIRDVARKFRLHLLADAYFCGNQKHELAKLQVLFDRDGAFAENPLPSSSSGGSEIWFYAAERSEPRKDIETGRMSIPSYDLVQQPREVCVRLHGHNMALEGFSSNIVNIASEKLSSALAQDR
jgi:hypothetical protein